MADDEETTEPDTPDTYTPRQTRRESVVLKAPHGEPREIEFKVYGGTTYQILEGEEADEIIGWGAVNQQHPALRKEAAEAARA